jgi:hypothetical protein
MYKLTLTQEEFDYLREFLAEEAEWIASAQHEGYGELVKGLYTKVKALPWVEEDAR